MGRQEVPTRNSLDIDRPLAAIFDKLDGDNRVLLETLRRRTLDQSLPLYLVGGPVRDALLGRPVKDLDFVLEGDSIALARTLAGELGWEVVAHRRFGTATLVNRGSKVDLVMARREVYDTPGALPRVMPGSIREDLARRDFSINALALPLYQPQPRIMDFHHGMEDLCKGVVRALHPNSFVDDPTRIMRAIRYERRLGFRLDPETEGFLGHALARGATDTVSGDRLRHELERILEEYRPAPVLERAGEMGVFRALEPAWRGAVQLSGLEGWLESIGPAERPLLPLIYLAGLVYPLPAQVAWSVSRRLNLTHRQSAVVRDAVALRQLEVALSLERVARSEVFQQLQSLNEAAVMAGAALCDNGLVRERLTEHLQELRFVRPALDGAAVVAMGVPPGPAVGNVIKKLRNARLDQRVKSEEEERQLVRQVLAQIGGG